MIQCKGLFSPDLARRGRAAPHARYGAAVAAFALEFSICMTLHCVPPLGVAPRCTVPRRAGSSVKVPQQSFFTFNIFT